MTEKPHLIVEKGPDVGKAIVVPSEGGRLGRSSRNDIVLTDPLLSRHHCRLFFKEADELWVTDLGSANQTIVNGVQIQETRLRNGDTIELGDSIIRVVNGGPETPATAPSPVQAEKAEGQEQPKPIIDLGLFDKEKIKEVGKTNRVPILVGLVVIVTVLALAAWLPKLLNKPRLVKRQDTSAQSVDFALNVAYEKVEATTDNIFRYALAIRDNKTLSVEIDDIQNDRHLRKEKDIDPALLKSIASAMLESGVLDLLDRYSGVQPDVLEQYDLTITVGKRSRRTVVVNRARPDAFKEACDVLENFGKNELGLWAIQFSSEKLLEMANESFLNGRKLYDEREIAYGNLAGALQRFSEAEWYLESVEPKPDFYSEVLKHIKDCKDVINQKYEDLNFRAARAVKMRQWPEAARELRIIRELIPDRSDVRNQEAYKSLLDVEKRLEGR